VDGAFGAAAILSPLAAPRLSGLRRADSLAFDFHKWMHVAYDAGCVLVRDGDAHLRSFYDRPDYLLNNLSGAGGGRERGIAAGRPWPTDFGPELSRGFRALKVRAGERAGGAGQAQGQHAGDQVGEKIGRAKSGTWRGCEMVRLRVLCELCAGFSWRGGEIIEQKKRPGRDGRRFHNRGMGGR
jgi:hypothetical protein